MRPALVTLLLLASPAAREASGQAPVGVIAGVVRDSSGAAISAARVVVINKSTGQLRPAMTTASGDYSVAALLAGVYEVTAEVAGFQRTVNAQVTVQAGSTTTVNMTLTRAVTGRTESVC